MTLKTVFEQKVADAILKLKWVIIAVTVIITAVFAYGFSILKFKVALEDMLPPANPFVKLNADFGHRFGGLTLFAIQVSAEDEQGIFTPERLKKLVEITDDVYFLDTVRRDLVWSITMNKAKEIKGLTGNIFINALMWPHPPDTHQGCMELKQKLLSSPLFAGRLVSNDGKHVLITGNTKEGVHEKEFFEALHAIKMKYNGQDGLTIKMVGRPVLMGWIYHFMPDMIIILAASLVVIFGVLSISFRTLQGLFVPFLAGILSTIWALGFMGLVGMNLNPLMIVLPFAVGIRAVSHTVQITSRFIEEYARHDDKDVAAQITAGSMFIPNISAIASDAAGFMFLVVVKITVVQQIAVAITFWLFAIFFTSAILTPVVCMFLPKPSEKKTAAIKKSWGHVADGKSGDMMDKIIFAFTRFFMGMGRPIAIAVMAAVIIFGGYLMKDLKSGDLSPGSPILFPDSDYNIASAEINKNFDKAGTDVLQIYFDGNGKNETAFAPPVLQTQERLHKLFQKKFPDTYSGWDSVVPIVKKMNIEMHEGDVKWDFVPDDPQLLGTVLSIYLAKLLPTDFNKYVDAETHSIGNVNYYFKNHMPDTINDAMTVTEEFFEELDLDISPYGEFKIAGGEIGVGHAINNEIHSVHYMIIFGVLILIFIICTFSFKSFTAGALLIIPLVASNMIAFSYMVIKGIGVTTNTLPVICVGLGIGVDFGIYLYTRFQEEYKNSNDYETAILTGCATAGKGVVHTALTMVVPLYLWYFISSIRFQGEMGLFLAIILTVNLMAVMFFHPAIVSKIKPKFITRMTME